MGAGARLAGAPDLPDLTRLSWLNGSLDERAAEPLPSYELSFASWLEDHCSTHVPFVGALDDGPPIGMAWLALVPRVPRPSDLGRTSADLQSVFVVPEHRGRGVGSALVRAVLAHAAALGIPRITVHSSTRAVPVYQRLGFELSDQLMQMSPTERPSS